MRIEIPRRSQGLAREPVHHLDGHRVKRRRLTRRIGELGIIVAHELQAIRRRHEETPIGLLGRANTDEFRELLHEKITLIEQSARPVAGRCTCSR